MTKLSWVLVGFVACGGGPADGAPSGQEVAAAPAAPVAKDVGVAALAEVQARGARIIDVRTLPEWNEGHVPGAVHVPLDQLTAESPALAGQDKAQPVYLICASGGRSKVAANRLAKAGFTAFNVEGGTNGWIAAGYPIEKPVPAAPTP